MLLTHRGYDLLDEVDSKEIFDTEQDEDLLFHWITFNF